VAHNQLKELPQSIGYLTKVSRLDISHNNLTSLPPQLGALVRRTSEPGFLSLTYVFKRLPCV
jgi:Leucine-rich repeat (LRR) protein